jgi:GMP synthase PP-ATPase subunit
MTDEKNDSNFNLHTPPPMEGAFRLKLVMNSRQKRLDVHLLEALRGQDDNESLKRISRSRFKKLFDDKKVLIKGQPAKPSSSLATGTTYVDIIWDGTNE